MASVANYLLKHPKMIIQRQKKVSLFFKEGMSLSKLIEASFQTLEFNPALVPLSQMEEAVEDLYLRVDDMTMTINFKVSPTTNDGVQQVREALASFDKGLHSKSTVSPASDLSGDKENSNPNSDS